MWRRVKPSLKASETELVYKTLKVLAVRAIAPATRGDIQCSGGTEAHITGCMSRLVLKQTLFQ
jgi:hypothetical protein